MNIIIEEVVTNLEIQIEETVEEVIIEITEMQVPGQDGYTPIKGVDYFDGVNGINGLDGINGEQGEKGDTGNQGLKGDKGDTGSVTVNGVDLVDYAKHSDFNKVDTGSSSINLYDKTASLLGTYVTYNTTNYLNQDISSSIVKVNGLSNITISGAISPNPAFLFLDKNENTIAFGNIASVPATLSVPIGAVFFQFNDTWHDDNRDIMQVESGVLASTYTAYVPTYVVTKIDNNKIEASSLSSDIKLEKVPELPTDVVPLSYLENYIGKTNIISGYLGSSSVNLYDKTASEIGFYIDNFNRNYINQDISSVSILVNGLSNITISGSKSDVANYRFVDGKGDYLTYGNIATVPTTLVVPINAVYFQFNDTWHDDNRDVIQVESGTSASNYTSYIPIKLAKKIYDYSLESEKISDTLKLHKYPELPTDIVPLSFITEKFFTNKWQNKKIAWIGDSMTQNGEIQSVIVDAIGCIAINVGVAGQTFTANGMNQAISATSQTPDAIVILLGTNDFSQSRVLGTMGTYNGTDFTSEVYKTLEYLRINNLTKPILLCTPFQRNAAGELPGKFAVNGNGTMLSDYVIRLRQLSELFSIPILDYYKDSGITSENVLSFAPDGLHINQTENGVNRASDMQIKALNDLYL